jgi:hypothetical protein
MHCPTVSEMSAPERARAVIALEPAGSAWRYQVTVGQWDQRPDELIDAPVYFYLVHEADLQLDPARRRRRGQAHAGGLVRRVAGQRGKPVGQARRFPGLRGRVPVARPHEAPGGGRPRSARAADRARERG